jgi:PhzF family phenazine biosynthesis protein
MILPIYQVDAFTSKLFGGNPAAVVPLDRWLDDGMMQNIAAENNLAETAFFVREGDGFFIRWMTPVTEVPLCGHATLAAAYVIFNFIEKDLTRLKFNSRSGKLAVERNGEILTLDFPAHKPEPVETDESITECFGRTPIETLKDSFFLLVIFDSEKYVRNLRPDFKQISKIHPHAVIISAEGVDCDFVSRMFAPNEGIDEDPVTGSAHTVLVPYWSGKLGKKNFRALQVSKRCGELYCEDLGRRVKISGKAQLFFAGNLFLSL